MKTYLIIISQVVLLLTNASADDGPETPDSLGSVPQTVSKNAIFPIAFYSDETSLAAGVMDQYLRKPPHSNKASSFLIFGFYTLNGQYLFETKPELYFARDRWKLIGEVEYTYWPTLHFGVGNRVGKDLSEKYTKHELSIDLALERKLSPHLYLGSHFVFSRQTFSDIKAGGLLDTQRPAGIEGGNSSGLGLSLSWDTRDNNINPQSGSYHQFSMNFYGSYLGSDFLYSAYKSDVRFYVPVFGDQVIALQNVLHHYRDTVPFQMMESVGDVLRGYEEDQILGASLHAFQLEYRLPLAWRIGLVAFTGAGQVAPNLSGFTADRYHPAWGFGFRFALIPEERLNLTFDIGFGDDNLTIDMNMLEAF